jgi:hypothetical protein
LIRSTFCWSIGITTSYITSISILLQEDNTKQKTIPIGWSFVNNITIITYFFVFSSFAEVVSSPGQEESISNASSSKTFFHILISLILF